MVVSVQLDFHLLEYHNIGWEDKGYFRLTSIGFSSRISLSSVVSKTLRTLGEKE